MLCMRWFFLVGRFSVSRKPYNGTTVPPRCHFRLGQQVQQQHYAKITVVPFRFPFLNNNDRPDLLFSPSVVTNRNSSSLFTYERLRHHTITQLCKITKRIYVSGLVLVTISFKLETSI